MDTTQSIPYNINQNSNSLTNAIPLQVIAKQQKLNTYTLYTLNKNDFFHLKQYSLQGSQPLILYSPVDTKMDTWLNIKYLYPQYYMNNWQHQYNQYQNAQQSMLENYQKLKQNQDVQEILSLGTDISKKSLELMVKGLSSGIKLTGQLIDKSTQKLDLDSETQQLFEQTKHSFKEAFKHSGKLVQKLSAPIIEKTKEKVKSIESTIENKQYNFSETVENVSNKTQQKSGEIITDIGKYLMEVGKSISNEEEIDQTSKQRK